MSFPTALWWRILGKSMRGRDQQDGKSHQKWQKQAQASSSDRERLQVENPPVRLWGKVIFDPNFPAYMRKPCKRNKIAVRFGLVPLGWSRIQPGAAVIIGSQNGPGPGPVAEDRSALSRRAGTRSGFPRRIPRWRLR